MIVFGDSTSAIATTTSTPAFASLTTASSRAFWRRSVLTGWLHIVIFTLWFALRSSAGGSKVVQVESRSIPTNWLLCRRRTPAHWLTLVLARAWSLWLAPIGAHRCVSIITLWWRPLLLRLLWTGTVSAGWPDSVRAGCLGQLCFTTTATSRLFNLK